MTSRNALVDDLRFEHSLDHQEADELVARQTDGVRPHRTAPTATDYLHTVHPDTGLDVVFVPGEALPDWAAAEVAARRANAARPPAFRRKGTTPAIAEG